MLRGKAGQPMISTNGLSAFIPSCIIISAKVMAAGHEDARWAMNRISLKCHHGGDGRQWGVRTSSAEVKHIMLSAANMLYKLYKSKIKN